MGVLTLDQFTRQRFQGATRYYKPGVKIPGQFKVFALDGNPLIYAAAMKAFEYGDNDCVIRENDHLSYNEKIELLFQYVWDQIVDLLNVVDCEEFYLGIDGVAPLSKMMQQRKRRYPRPEVPKGEFDSTQISCGTEMMHSLCGFIKYKIQKDWIKDSLKKFIFSSHNVVGEGEAKCMKYLRTFPPRTRVILMSPDGDLILLGLLNSLDFFLFKVDHNTRNGYDKQFYTIRMQCIKPQIAKKSPGIHIIDATKAFVFLATLLGNDFCPRLECLQVFINGCDDMYFRYQKLGKSLIVNGRLDKYVLTELLYALANEESSLLEKRTQHPFPLLEKHLTKEHGKLDFLSFRKEYYETWLKIKEDEIAQVCYLYLDTLWFVWCYYGKGIPPQWNFYYKHHYAPLLYDLAAYSKHWRIPHFKSDAPRTPFQQLVAILPPSRKQLLPTEYHNIFDDSEYFPDPTKDIVTNSQGRGDFEITYELPIFDKQIDVVDKVKYARNRVDKDRVFTRGEQEYYVINKKYGEFITNVEG